VIRIIFASVFLILLATYIFTIRKLKPLRKLKQEIDKFARGDLEEVTCNSTGSDEISEVALAFYNAVGQIKALNQSRQLFLRNIMHELKTPITKGRITAEMVTQEKYKTRLITVFEKLETLINEFASIERITSGIGLSDVKGYRLVDLIDEAVDLAMVESQSVQRNISEEIILHVDFKLFSIALKNMIDNGIKYSKENASRLWPIAAVSVLLA
jgi:two-component system OmpR family sensor kinase